MIKIRIGRGNSLYFGHFFKVVDNDTSKIREMWIKLRKRKHGFIDMICFVMYNIGTNAIVGIV